MCWLRRVYVCTHLAYVRHTWWSNMLPRQTYRHMCAVRAFAMVHNNQRIANTHGTHEDVPQHSHLCSFARNANISQRSDQWKDQFYSTFLKKSWLSRSITTYTHRQIHIQVTFIWCESTNTHTHTHIRIAQPYSDSECRCTANTDHSHPHLKWISLPILLPVT